MSNPRSRSSINRKKKQLLNTVTVNLGCSSCSRPKLSSIFTTNPNPSPNLKQKHIIPHSKKKKNSSYHKTHLNQLSALSSSSTSSYNSHYPFFSSTNTAASTPEDYSYSSYPYYYNYQTPTTNTDNTNSTSTSVTTAAGPEKIQKKKKKTVAVEKDSVDPYVDFRASMLQMIVENDIRDKAHLKELLNCFLQLNSPSLHDVIIRAFTDIWNGCFFQSATTTTGTGTSTNTNTNTNNNVYNADYYYDCNYNNYSYNYNNGRFRSGYYASPRVYSRTKSS